MASRRGMPHDHGAGAAAGQKAWALSLQGDAHQQGGGGGGGGNGDVSGSSEQSGSAGKGQSQSQSKITSKAKSGEAGAAGALDRLLPSHVHASAEGGLADGGEKDDADADGSGNGRHADALQPQDGGRDDAADLKLGKDAQEPSSAASCGDDGGQQGEASVLPGQGASPDMGALNSDGEGSSEKMDKGQFEKGEKSDKGEKRPTGSRQPRFWTAEEHKKFLEAVRLYGYGNARQIAAYVQTRNITQVLPRSLCVRVGSVRSLCVRVPVWARTNAHGGRLSVNLCLCAGPGAMHARTR
jgi:hypothetical protein